MNMPTTTVQAFFRLGLGDDAAAAAVSFLLLVYLFVAAVMVGLGVVFLCEQRD
jgi:hypothetical protein